MTNKTPYLLAFIFAIIAFIVGAVGFGTGYWYVAEGEGRLFKRLGLWEACFDGYEHTSDYIGKAYFGCWWIFHKEYSYVRQWILPPWFVAVQTLMTFALTLQVIGLAVFPGAGGTSDKANRETAVSVITGVTTLCIGLGTLIFGAMIGEDRTWMPRPDSDEPSWSYGLAVISGFFSAFSCISMTVFTVMRRYDLQPKNYGDTSFMKGKAMNPMVPRV